MKNEVVRALSATLENGADVHRCAAARALGEIGSRRSVEVLVAALLDEDPDVRTDAAEALGRLNDASCAGALMENLIDDPECDVKKAAIAALVGFGHAPVVAVLRKLVVSRSEDISWDDDEFYADGWDSWLDIQLQAIRGLAQLGTEAAVPEIFAAMSDEAGQDLSGVGVEALAALGRPGADALTQLYEAGSTRLRRRIADAVAAATGPWADELRERMLKDSHAQVRLAVVSGLDPDDPRLLPLFADPDSEVRASVVRHTGALFPERIVDLIEDGEARVRTEVFRVIAADPDSFAGEDLKLAVRQAIAGEPEAAKQAALAWIALEGPAGMKGLTHVLTKTDIPIAFRVGVIEALQKAGEICVPHLLRAAGDEERSLRLAVLTALEGFAANDPRWPNPAGVGLLAALNGELVLPPEEPEEEQAKADVVEEDDPEAVAEEQQEIDETMPLVPQRGATSTLDAILSGGPEAASKADVEEPAPVELSERDLRFLELSKKRAVSKKKMSLDSTVAPFLDVRRFAARLLGGVVNPEVTENLIAVLAQDDPDLSEAALTSLVQHGEKTGGLPGSALEPVMEFIGSDDTGRRVLAVRALGFLADAETDTTLHELLSDKEEFVRVEAIRTLDRRGIADDAVAGCLKDGYLGVGLAAARSLARHRGGDTVDALVDFAFRNDGIYRRDVGRMLGEHAAEAGAARLVEILGDDSYRRDWLVAIDALAELFRQHDQHEERKVA